MLRRRDILSLTARKDPVKNKVKWPFLFCSHRRGVCVLWWATGLGVLELQASGLHLLVSEEWCQRPHKLARCRLKKTATMKNYICLSAGCRMVSSLCFTCRWEISLIWAANPLPQSIQKTVGAEASGKKLHIFEHWNTIHILLQWK